MDSAMNGDEFGPTDESRLEQTALQTPNAWLRYLGQIGGR